jgi:hypothetical protein
MINFNSWLILLLALLMFYSQKNPRRNERGQQKAVLSFHWLWMDGRRGPETLSYWGLTSGIEIYNK